MNRILPLIVISLLCIQCSVIAQSTEFKWAKGIGSEFTDRGESIITDAVGNIYVAGHFELTVDFDPGMGIAELNAITGSVFIAKFDPSGDFIWVKQLGGSKAAIKLDDAGNVYAVGNFTGTADFDPGTSVHNLTSSGNVDIFMVKLNNEGNFVWAKQMGGPLEDGSATISLSKEGNIHIGGFFADTADFDPGPGVFNLINTRTENINPSKPDCFIAKYTDKGELLWAKSFGSVSNASSTNAVSVDVSGNIIATGTFLGPVDFNPGPDTVKLSSGSVNIFVIKLDASGDFVWARQMGGKDIDRPNSIAIDATGNIYTAGEFRGIADFNPGADTFNLSNNATRAAFISKLDANGNFQWAKQISSGSSANIFSIFLDRIGDIYLGGHFLEKTDFDPGSATYIMTPIGKTDAFVAKLHSDGEFVWAKKMGGSDGDNVNALTVDALGNVYSTGLFSTTANFNTESGELNLSSAGGTDIFVHKISQEGFGTSIFSESNERSLKIFPNPVRNKFTVQIPFQTENLHLTVYSIKGFIISEYSLQSDNSVQVDLQDQPIGMYIIQCKSHTENFVSIVNKVE